MKRGINSLATISSIAPFIGLFGTLIGIVNSFHGVGIDKDTGLALIAESLSESLVPTEMGLVVSLIAFCSYRCLLANLDDFDVETECASSQLISDLASTNI